VILSLLYLLCLIGGYTQEFKLDIDFVNGGSRKLFRSDKLPLIYWWETYSGIIMHSSNKGYVFVCPCRLVNSRLVICMILKTRCNKSHIDALIYNMDTNKCFVAKQSESKWISQYKCDLLAPFDLLRVEAYDVVDLTFF
jgi:hypothetical protein